MLVVSRKEATMKLVQKTRIVSPFAGVLIVVALITPLSASAAEFYLDPRVTGGTHVGTQANPFNTLDGSAWTRVNNALATADVTVYCSARQTGSDTNSMWLQAVDLTQRTAGASFRLTFDGQSKWNSGPTWSNYSGQSRCQNQGFSASGSGASSPKVNNMTITGFVIIQTPASESALWGCIVCMCGDNWIVQNNDISSTFQSSVLTTGILMIPSANATAAQPFEGAASPCPRSTNIQILNNKVHGTSALNVYIGGGGCRAGVTQTDGANFNVGANQCQTDAANPTGYSHSNILIQGNEIYDCVTHGPGDTSCLDLKGALSNVTIRGNHIHNEANGPVQTCLDIQGTTTANSGGGFGPVNQNILIERNLIHNCPGTGSNSWQGVTVTNTWGTPNGVVIRNNIIYNINRLSGGASCLHVEDAQPQNGVQFYNNTVYNCDGSGISVYHSAPNYNGTVTLQNNAVLNPGQPATSLAGSVVSDHNAYVGTWSGTCTSCLAELTSAAFVNATTPNFHVASNSVLIKAGLNLSAAFTNDYAGSTRPRSGAWSIGAYEFTTASPQTPSPPQTLRLQ
jgi:Right handed beta helix region